MAFAALTIDLNARLASFEEGLKRAERAATDSAGRIERAFGLAGKGLAALGGVLSVGALAGFARQAVSSAAALDDMAEATGGSVEGLSKLVDIARIGGGSIDTVSTAVSSLNKALTNPNADENKGVGAALRAIGLNAEDLLRMAPEKRIEAIAVAMQQFEDGAGKGNVAFTLFKRTAGEVVPFLNDVAENLDRASSATKEQAAQAELLEKRWNALGVAAGNYARQGLFAVIDGYARLIPYIERFGLIGGTREFFAGDLTGATAPQLQARAEKLRRDIETSKNDSEAQQLSAELARIETRLAELNRQAQVTKKALNFVPPQAGGSRSRASAKGKSDTYVSDVFGASVQDLERFQTELDRARRGFVGLIEPQQAFFDKMNELDRMAPLLGLTADQVERIRDALRAQADEAEFGKPLQDIVAKTGEANDLVEELGLTFSSAFEDAIAGGKGLRDILSGIEQDLIRIITRKLVTEPIGNAISGALGGVAPSGLGGVFDKVFGGLVVSILGAKEGGIFPGGFQAFEAGGVVRRPTLGLVGEGAFSEAIVPLPNGRAIPVEMRGGGATVVMNITTPDVSGFRASQGQILADAQRALARGRRNL